MNKSIEELTEQFDEIIEYVEKNKDAKIVITRDGKPVALLVPSDIPINK